MGFIGGVPVFAPDFFSALSCAEERNAAWYAVRFARAQARIIFRLMDVVGLEYHHLTYEHRRPRKPPTVRSWFPGYFFTRFDIERDRWHQMLGMPGVIEILGDPSPLPQGCVEDIVSRCPRRLPRNTALCSVPAGTRVRVKEAGELDGVVVRSDYRDAWLMVMMFGAPREMRVSLGRLEMVG